MVNIWTEKHLRMAVSWMLPLSARDLYEYLVLEEYEGRPQVLDLREFNKYIEKRRGRPYDRRTIKDARNRLESAGFLVGCKKFTEFVWYGTLRSIAALFPLEKRRKDTCIDGNLRSVNASLRGSNGLHCVEGDYTTTTNPSTDTSPEITIAELLESAPVTESSYLEQNLQQCEDAGIEFNDPKEAAKVLSQAHPEDVMNACDYYRDYCKRNKVENPAGFLRRCLQRRWWEKTQKVTFFDALLALCVEMNRLKRE